MVEPHDERCAAGGTWPAIGAGRLEVARRFDSGIEVGAFASFTSASYSEFGEGSFDKGIFIRVPLDLFGVQTRSSLGAVIRPVQRDGGQRLAVENQLWDRRGMGGKKRCGAGWRGSRGRWETGLDDRRWTPGPERA